jgi:PKD repeat protein
MKEKFIQITILICFMFNTFIGIGQTNYAVHFKGHTEFLEENFKSLEIKPFLLTQSVQGRSFIYLQFYEIPLQSTRKTMESQGISFLSYFQYGTYLVSIPENINWADFNDFKIRSIANVAPDWKLASNLIQKPYPKWAVRGDKLVVNLQIYEEIKTEDALVWLGQFGIKTLKKGTQNGFLQVLIPADKIQEIAQKPFIRYLELIPAPSQPEDTGGRSLHRSNVMDSDAPMGKHYNGAGQKVLTRDDGGVGPHIDFQGRLTNEPFDYGGTHGDGVTGIIGSAGNLDPSYKGMAAGADLYAVDYVNDFQDNTLPLHQLEGVNATNSSYSDGCNDGYTLATQTVDQQLHQNPQLMHVFSAGNSGELDCGFGAGSIWGNITGGHKMAKNAIATANLYADGILEISSSRGPAHDGRIKPDIAAHGQNQGSTNPDNTYQVFGGTSGAAPGIAGCFTQLGQAFMAIENGVEAPAALLKATMLVTANDMGNKGPDFKFGWGHINANHALRLLEQKNWLQSTIDQSGNGTFVLNVPNNVKEARWMLYWADPEASESAAKALINDLDLSVIRPDGSILLPWVLDPTPNAATLNNPATNGKDRLNNMEEVALDVPLTGNYIIEVKGFEVPMGPQQFYLVWEYLTDSIELTYPNGGEGFVPGEIERLHWDAVGTSEGFQLEYSNNNGGNWENIASLTDEKRMFEWIVPASITANAKIRLTRGNQTDSNDFPFSIAPLSQNVVVSRVCPDSMTVQCSDFDSLSVNIYLLGQKYMELKGNTTTNFLVFPLQNPQSPQWLSAAVTNAQGMTGRRNIAQYYAGGLLNCNQPYDVNLVEIIQPTAVNVQCSPFNSVVKLKIRNDGLNPITSATASYQLGNNAIVTEVLPTIGVNVALEFIFSETINFNENGLNTLKIWTSLPADNVNFNDTLVQNLNIVVSPENDGYEQNFDLVANPPLGWSVNNPDNGQTWQEFTVIGTEDVFSKSYGVSFFSYNARGEEDYLVSIPVNLSGLSNPSLLFDLAKAGYDANYKDGLRIEVLANCDINATPVVVYLKEDPELGTVPATTAEFSPMAGTDWRTEIVSLSAFAGQNVILRFVALNDYGNNLYIDNIRFSNFDATPPIAAFAAPDTACRLDSILFTSQSTGSFLNYQWSFGTQATPSSAIGVGPHSVKYLTSGNKTVRLLINNPLGADTLIKTMTVLGLATANYGTNIVQNTVQFNNSSTNATNYLWDFGDGNTSTLKNPFHTYASTGTYTVKLISSNFCKISEKILTVNITTVGFENIENEGVINISPNPNHGIFNIEYQSKNAEVVQIELVDSQGKLIEKIDFYVSQGANKKSLGNRTLPAGVYSLKMLGREGLSVFKVVVQ